MATRILILEDESIVAMDLQSRLETLGYEVIGIANSAEEAIKLSETDNFDLILADIMLKGKVDGIDTVATIQKGRDVPAIFLTAYSDEQTLSRAKLTAPGGYIVKPFNERELRATIEIALYRHSVETKLRKLERWLASTLNSIGDAVISTDVDGFVNYLNPMAERMLGWKPKEAYGKHIGDVFNLVDENTHEPRPNPVLIALKKEIVVQLEESTSVITKSGRELPIDDSAAPIRNDFGTITGAVVIFRDISVLKEANKARRIAEEQLRHSQKMETIGQLAGGVAHDFNNLLTVILGQSELLDDRITDPKDKKTLRAIVSAAGKAASLTRQLLAFSRKQVLQPELLDLNSTLTEVENILVRLIGEDIEIVTSLQADLPVVKVDPTQIEQVILNLAVNARDAMPNGGKLSIETKSVELNEEYCRQHTEVQPGSFVMLSISDNGMGMDAATQARIFEPFFTTKELGKGTGLGLATVYGIVRQSGGRIEVYSEIGHGTVFKIYFPQGAQALVPVVKPTTPMPISVNGTVLLIEDDEGVRELVADTLRHHGYSVLIAVVPEDARNFCRRQELEIDLVISDIIMPRENGPAIVSTLKAIRPELKTLFMSGYSDLAIVRNGLLSPDADFIEKPFRPTDLVNLVDKIIRRSEANQQTTEKKI